jgi:hypothetical protein
VRTHPAGGRRCGCPTLVLDSTAFDDRASTRRRTGTRLRWVSEDTRFRVDLGPVRRRRCSGSSLTQCERVAERGNQSRCDVEALPATGPMFGADVWSAAFGAVDGLAKKIGVTVVPGVFLDHVYEDPAHRETRSLSLIRADVVERIERLEHVTCVCAF